MLPPSNLPHPLSSLLTLFSFQLTPSSFFLPPQLLKYFVSLILNLSLFLLCNNLILIQKFHYLSNIIFCFLSRGSLGNKSLHIKCVSIFFVFLIRIMSLKKFSGLFAILDLFGPFFRFSFFFNFRFFCFSNIY